MPCPEGYSEAECVHRDRIAKKLEGNYGVSAAFAIATSVVNKEKGKANEKD